MTYKGCKISKLTDDLINNYDLQKLKTDSEKWRVYYKNYDSNWISFYPFSEYHGGGQSYIIQINNFDFENWINENPNFESDIRDLIEKE